jgi:hypothetical protein
VISEDFYVRLLCLSRKSVCIVLVQCLYVFQSLRFVLPPSNVLRRMAVNGEDYRTRPVFDPEAHGLSREFRYFFHCCTVHILWQDWKCMNQIHSLKISKKLEGNQNLSVLSTSISSDLKSTTFLYGLPVPVS